MLDEPHWDALIDQIIAGACTPVIGAGACHGILPMGGELANALAEQHQFPIRQDSQNLAQVAQFIAVQSDSSVKPKSEIASRLSGRLTSVALGADDVHRVLAEAELPIYLTTNYDHLMFRALLEHQRKDALKVEPIRETCRWNRNLIEDLGSMFDDGTYQPSPIKPVVFHLHGRLDALETMVATEDDYLDFLVNISKDLSSSPMTDGQNKKAALPLRIRRALRSTSLLFIGYSLNDVNFRMILRALVSSLEKANRQLSVTLQLKPDDKQHADYLIKYFAWTFNLHVAFGTAAEFAGELRKKLTLRRQSRT